MVWSFFVPPVGAVLGIRALLAGWRDGRDDDRAEAWVAILNGVVGTVVVVAAIVLLPLLYHWYRDALAGVSAGSW